MTSTTIAFLCPSSTIWQLRSSNQLITTKTTLYPQTRRKYSIICSSSSSKKTNLQNDASSPSSSIESPSRASMEVSKSVKALIDETDNEPLLHVVFVQPQIHFNTGNIGRTCLGLGARLHLIPPLGFSLDARQVRRAGLDYWDHVDVHVYDNWLDFANNEMKKIGGTRYFFTKFGTQCITKVQWPKNEKIVLFFGSEIDGFDGIRDWLDKEGRKENLIAFPMVDDRFRSFNLSTTASMALWDAFKSIKSR